MEGVTLEPPYDRAMLEEICARAQERERDFHRALGWLETHSTAQAITYGIRSLWLKSSLPLSRWALDIEDFALCTNEDRSDLQIAARFRKDGHPPVRQMIPFTPTEYAQAVATFPCTPPEIVREIALTAPGLSLDDVGALVPARYLLYRFAETNEKTEGMHVTPEECVKYKCVFPDPDRFLMEVANNGQGCAYVMDCEERVYYHDYGDLPGVILCTPSFDEMVRAYSVKPPVLWEPYEPGWATYPGEESAS